MGLYSEEEIIRILRAYGFRKKGNMELKFYQSTNPVSMTVNSISISYNVDIVSFEDGFMSISFNIGNGTDETFIIGIEVDDIDLFYLNKVNTYYD